MLHIKHIFFFLENWGPLIQKIGGPLLREWNMYLYMVPFLVGNNALLALAWISIKEKKHASHQAYIFLSWKMAALIVFLENWEPPPNKLGPVALATSVPQDSAVAILVKIC